MVSAFVDRIEGEWAVLVVGAREVRLPAAALAPGVREGDYVELKAERAADSEARAQAVAQRRRELAEGDDGGDIKL